MISTLALALSAVAVFAWYAPRRAHLLPPRTATYLLAAGAVTATGVVIGVVALAGSTVVVQLPPVAAAGEWSRPDLRSTDPVPVWLAMCCCALLVAAVVHSGYHAVLRAQAYVRLHRECRDLVPAIADPPVIVLDCERPEAYATPAGGGRILVTTGLLSVLPEDERRVLFAHEAAHLRHKHPWWVLAVDLCARANPMLRGVARATAQATERWADEDAAAVVGDRELVARAVARAALHLSKSGTGRGNLGAGHQVPHGHGSPPARRSPRAAAVGGQIPQRVHALLAPPPRPHRALTLGLILLLVAGLGCAVLMQRRTDAFLDLAGSERPTTIVTQPIGHNAR